MKVRALKDFKWSVNFKAVVFLEGEIYDIDTKLANEIMKVGYIEKLGSKSKKGIKDCPIKSDCEFVKDNKNGACKYFDAKEDGCTNEKKINQMEKKDLVEENKVIESAPENKAKKSKKKNSKKK